MSERQFWQFFGQQLAYENSPERLALDLTKFTDAGVLATQANALEDYDATGGEEAELALRQPKSRPSFNLSAQAEHSQQATDQMAPSERVVFVRPPIGSQRSRTRISSSETSKASLGTHKIRARSSGSADSLELVSALWNERTGFPLVSASLQRDRLTLRQERFSFAWAATGEGSLEPSSWTLGASRRRRELDEQRSLEELWPIPLLFVSRFNPRNARFLWLDKVELELPIGEFGSDLTSLEGSRKAAWFKLNVNQTSLVRVNYDERNWEALSELLGKSHYSNHLLNPLDRANLIDDALTLMRCGRLSVGLAMNLTLYLEVGERDYMPWLSALRHLDQMQNLLNQNPLWHRFVLKLMQPISSVIGWKDDGPHLMRKLRRSLFAVALQYGDEKTVLKAKQDFKSWLKSGRFIVPNLQELVYVAGVRYGDQQEWFYCWQKYQQLVANDNRWLKSSSAQEKRQPISKERPPAPLLVAGSVFSDSPASESSEATNTENEKRQLLTALASTQNTWLLEQFLNYSLDSSKIQTHHLKHVMQTLSKNPVARLYLWRFVRLNWNTLMDNFVSSQAERTLEAEYYQVIETMITESTKHFATKLDYDELKSFFDAKRGAWSQNLERAIQLSLQVVRSNIYWRDFIEPKITRWLSYSISV